MSKVNTSAPVRMHRQNGPDYRVRKADVERSMLDKSVMVKTDREILNRNVFRNTIECIVTTLGLQKLVSD